MAKGAILEVTYSEELLESQNAPLPEKGSKFESLNKQIIMILWLKIGLNWFCNTCLRKIIIKKN